MKTPILLALIASGFLAACGKSDPVETPPEKPDPKPEVKAEEIHPTLPAGGAVLEGSLHDLESEWQNQDATAGTLADHLGGKIQVVSMGYSTCKFACPALLADMRRIQDGLDKAAVGSKVGFSFVSIDPDNDTPARLKEFEKESEFDPAVWTLLRSEADNVLELAVVLGMKYRKTTVDDFAHSNIITIIAPNGAVLHQQEGINADPTKTIALIKEQLQKL
jgi:protein SCO1/2